MPLKFLGNTLVISCAPRLWSVGSISSVVSPNSVSISSRISSTAMESNCATTAPNSWSSSKGADSQRHVAAMMEASFSLSSAGSGRDTGGSGGSRVDMLDMSVIDEGQDGAGTHLTGGHGRLDLEVAGADAEQPAAGRQSFERSAHAVFHFPEARVAILAGYRVCQPNLDADAARTL